MIANRSIRLTRQIGTQQELDRLKFFDYNTLIINLL